ncbi:MAG: MarR family transcriptional regulator [Candidatus Hodarchaeota archaeon]
MSSPLLGTYVSGLPRSRKVILSLLVNQGPLSPTEIMKLTEIKKRTVLNSLQDLKRRNLVERTIVLEDLRKVRYYFVGNDEVIETILNRIRDDILRKTSI